MTQTIICVYLFLAIAFFYALPPYKNSDGETDWLVLFSQIALSLIWPAPVAIKLFYKILN